MFKKLKDAIVHSRLKLRSMINCLLENNYDYFLCYYPGNSGFFIKKLIKRLVSNLNFDDHNLEKIKDIHKESIVVYTSKNKRILDFLYFHTKLKSHDMAFPQIGFDFSFFFLLPVKRIFQIFICQMDYFLHHFHFKDAYMTDYVTRELLNGKAGFIGLIEEDDFYKRFIKATPDPLYLLIKFQKKIDKSILIVPESIIYVTKPMRKNPSLTDILFGTHENPGLAKRLFTILKRPEKIRVELSNPLNLKEFVRQPEIEQLDAEFQTHRLRSHLVDVLNRQRKSITGPVLKSRQEITEDILTRRSLREYLADYASKNNLTLRKTHTKAAGYIKEIASNYNMQAINLLNWFLTWVFKNIFENLILNQAEINRMREISTEAPLILVPCHKSHLDYLLLPYVMLKNNMPCPHIAAGKNLAFWPLGPLFRGGGAFFLRRTFKGSPLYTKIFAAYLEKLLFEGFNIKIFIEGGRSRTGKLLAPKPGGLAMLINAYQNGACNNLYFVPIFIGYDRVLEEDAYLKEIEGGKKNPETLKGLISARRFLKKKYGKVYMRFDAPISIKEYITEKGIDLSKTSNAEYINFVKSFGYKLINSINKNAVAAPHGIIASAVLNCLKNSFTKKQMIHRVNAYMNMLTQMNAELSESLLIDPENTLNSVIHTFISRNFIELGDEDDKDITDNTIFIIKDNKRAVLDYYKNSVISFFVYYAYTAVAILGIDRFRFSSADLVLRYRFLEKMFTDEFFFDEETTCEENISTSIKGFIAQGILVPDLSEPAMCRITSKGLRKLKWFAAFMLPFLESYKTTLFYFEKYDDDTHNQKDRIKKIHSIGSKLYKTKIVTYKESLSRINYQNAANFFMKSGVTGPEKISYYKETLERLIHLIAT